MNELETGAQALNDIAHNYSDWSQPEKLLQAFEDTRRLFLAHNQDVYGDDRIPTATFRTVTKAQLRFGKHQIHGNALAKGPWQLDGDAFFDTFGAELALSETFLKVLLKLMRRQPDWGLVWPALKTARDKRHGKAVLRRHKLFVRRYKPMDVKLAAKDLGVQLNEPLVARSLRQGSKASTSASASAKASTLSPKELRQTPSQVQHRDSDVDTASEYGSLAPGDSVGAPSDSGSDIEPCGDAMDEKDLDVKDAEVKEQDQKVGLDDENANARHMDEELVDEKDVDVLDGLEDERKHSAKRLGPAIQFINLSHEEYKPDKKATRTRTKEQGPIPRKRSDGWARHRMVGVLPTVLDVSSPAASSPAASSPAASSPAASLEIGRCAPIQAQPNSDDLDNSWAVPVLGELDNSLDFEPASLLEHPNISIRKSDGPLRADKQSPRNRQSDNKLDRRAYEESPRPQHQQSHLPDHEDLVNKEQPGDLSTIAPSGQRSCVSAPAQLTHRSPPTSSGAIQVFTPAATTESGGNLFGCKEVISAWATSAVSAPDRAATDTLKTPHASVSFSQSHDGPRLSPRTRELSPLPRKRQRAEIDFVEIRSSPRVEMQSSLYRAAIEAKSQHDRTLVSPTTGSDLRQPKTPVNTQSGTRGDMPGRISSTNWLSGGTIHEVLQVLIPREYLWDVFPLQPMHLDVANWLPATVRYRRPTAHAFVPLNFHDAHWTLLYFDFDTRRATRFDPLAEPRTLGRLGEIARRLVHFWSDNDKEMAPAAADVWTTQNWQLLDPPRLKQENSWDCGIFCLFLAVFIAARPGRLHELPTRLDGRLWRHIFGALLPHYPFPRDALDLTPEAWKPDEFSSPDLDYAHSLINDLLQSVRCDIQDLEKRKASLAELVAASRKTVEAAAVERAKLNPEVEEEFAPMHALLERGLCGYETKYAEFERTFTGMRFIEERVARVCGTLGVQLWRLRHRRLPRKT